MDLEIICVGDELVEGLVPDKNIRILNSLLFKLGQSPVRVSLVKDNPTALRIALESAIVRSKLTIITGGLGTTPDDITREVVAAVLDENLVENPEIVKQLKELFEKRGLVFEENVKRMAQFPEGARIIKNRIGHAPGFIIERQERWLFILPGVPEEVQVMAEEECMDEWKSLIGDPGEYRWELIRTCGMAEHQIASKLEKILTASAKVSVKYRAGGDGVDLLVSFREIGRSAGSEFKVIKSRIIDELKHSIYGYGDETLESVVGKLLTDHFWTISVAESCTGGLIGNRLTDVPGSSQYFLEGVIVYSDAAKTRLLGIEPQFITDYGAVSEQVAEAMARGIKERAGTTLGLAITGIAGPAGGSDRKPVGTVFIGLAHEGGVSVDHYFLYGGRIDIKYQASSLALDAVRRLCLAQ